MGLKWLLCGVFFFSPCLTSAAPPPATAAWGDWQEARTFYDSGRYEDALAIFKSHPLEEASYFYNLGNIYYRLSKYGIATAYFEKANRLRPHDPDIQFNLNLSKQVLIKQLGVDRLDPASSWLESVADNIPLNEVRGTLGLASFILSLFWIHRYLKSRRLRKALLHPASLLASSAVAITLVLYSAQRMATSQPPAASIESTVVRSGPGDHFLELEKVEAGTKLRLLGPTETQNQEIWRQVRYSPDGVGWVRASSLLLL